MKKATYKIIADLHTHTIASGHGIDTIRTLCEFARRKGLQGIAITDHGPGLPGGADFIYFLSLRRMTDGIKLPIRIFTGVEDDIMSKDGKLTLPEDVLSKLDIVMTGLHPATWIFQQPKIVRTEAVIRAITRRIIRVFTHPVRYYYDLDMGPIIEAATESDVALELNTSKQEDKKLVISFLEQCAKKNTRIVVNSDAHLGEEVGVFEEAKIILEEIDFPQNLIINRSKEAISSFFGVKW
jgi:putative hydrolase